MADVTTLTYFRGRGRAEPIRLLLNVAGIKFSEVYLTERQQFLKLVQDGALLFNQVPLLEIDGLKLVQTGSILRYVARKAGLLGNNDQEAARIDMLFEGTRDFYAPFIRAIFIKIEDMKKELESVMFPRYLPIFNTLLKENVSGYITGSQLTLADLGLLETLLAIEDYFEVDSILAAYPHIVCFLAKMKAFPAVTEYIGKSRKLPNDQEYVDTVQRVLARIKKN